MHLDVGVRRSKTLRRVNLTPTSSPWVGDSPTHREDVVVKFMAPVYHRCLSGTLVSEQSVAHTRPGTPWHMHRNFWFPRASCRTWIGFGACTFLHIVSSCHEVIPGGTKATIVGVDEDGDLPVFTDDGKTMVTWCSIWLQVWERQCRPLIPTSPTLQWQKSDDQTTLNNSCAKSSNVLLQTRSLLCRSTSRGLAF